MEVGILEYERQWENYTQLRQEIVLTRRALLDYANAFAEIAGLHR
jgi:hypothetical protein